MLCKNGLKRIGVLCFLMLGLFGLNSFANAHRDEGQYQIVEARYGTLERNVDVTEQLKDLAKRDIRFRMGNESFGIDPHPNHVKFLRIFARDGRGGTRSFEYAEGSIVDGSLFKAWGSDEWEHRGHHEGAWDGREHADRGDRNERDAGEYQIVQARYGTSQRNADVTERLKQLARADRVFQMNNDSFGIDPHPNHVKTLRIFARDSEGQMRTFEYAEGELLDGALFKSWQTGDWATNEPYRGGWGVLRKMFRAEEVAQQQSVNSLEIISAEYGAAGVKVDVLPYLQMRVRAGSLSMHVDNASLGNFDPVPGRVKVLRIRYLLNGGSVQQLRIKENDWLHL